MLPTPCFPLFSSHQSKAKRQHIQQHPGIEIANSKYRSRTYSIFGSSAFSSLKDGRSRGERVKRVQGGRRAVVCCGICSSLLYEEK
uniref:C2H2-type domain-containing protein n=1 Tax=Ascaris lumbricoides TaxID=6252 RepID=A0A0M3I2L1_ASCLU